MAGSSWPSLLAGKKAKASEVESKFDWLEQSLVPMLSGSTTDLTYDLGTSTARWRGLWVGGINPTTTADGVAVGTTTVANASTGFELAGTAKAILVSRMTTAQRTALTALNGMIVYDTMVAAFYIYENGAWQTMGNKIGLVDKINTSTVSTVTQTAYSVTGSGRLRALSVEAPGGSLSFTRFNLVIDSVSTGDIFHNTTTAGPAWLAADSRPTTTVFYFTNADGQPVDVMFKSQLKIYMRNTVGSTTQVGAVVETS